MELLLNLTWLLVSAVLGVLLLTTRSKYQAPSQKLTYTRATAWISYLVLIALLLPAISMTDDLTAMVAPTDGEQIVRRYEVPAGAQPYANLHTVLFRTVRDAIWVAPVYSDGLEILPPFHVFRTLPRRFSQDRAPPFVA